MSRRLGRYISFGAVFLISFALWVTAAQSKTATTVPAGDVLFKPSPVQEEAERYLGRYLMQYHFRRVSVNDSLSQEVLSRFLDQLDETRTYFVASQVESFQKEIGNNIDDEFLAGKADAGFRVYNTFLKQAKQKMHFMIDLLDTARFDFSVNETFDLKRNDAPWPSDMAELQDRWRKEAKYQVLNLKYSGEEPDEKPREVLLKRYKNRLSLLEQQSDEDAFRAFNYALTTSFDPHTNYFSPLDYENFQIDMSRSLEGVGAKLQNENEYTVVNEIIPGGPAFRGGLLKKGDRIIGVGQGKEGAVVDIVGWRVNDVVQLIRGKKGSVVRLKILPVSQGNKGPAKIVEIVRDEVKLEEQSAQKEIIMHNGRKIGVISVPAFYLDFEGQKQNKPDYKSTSKDVREILAELKKEGVEGIVLDLRNNGGGALEEAVKLTGLFIPEGPVVQVKNSHGGVMVLRDKEADVGYSGPLAVLVNRYSASASEILAAAIQDYGRGVVIGGRTFGKGTVQSILKINRPFNFFYKKNDDLGQVKLTIAKFYRISGESTQHLGVTPDIVIPSFIDPEKVGEDTYTSSLGWDVISPASHSQIGRLSEGDVSFLREKHFGRIHSDSLYARYVNDLDVLNSFRKKEIISLYEPDFKVEMDRIEGFEAQWNKEEEPDMLLMQSAAIVSDMADLLQEGFAGRDVAPLQANGK
ncbi:MAG: carboxy terminal-processing peptidase [Chlorobiales bacterium]|nr:carboxy terminal-processing peptidase [Chlorobiales bacterium]